MRETASTLNDTTAVRKRIRQYPAEGDEEMLLSKLAGEDRALRALAAMRLTDRQLDIVLLSCIEAAEIVRTFEGFLKKEAAMLKRLERLRNAVSQIAEFVNEVLAPPARPLSASINIDVRDKRRYLAALSGIDALINDRATIAAQTPVRIGATRKNRGKAASQNAGLGWLAASIARVTKKPHYAKACVLAETIFGINEVSEERLRGAYRNFADRDWRAVE